MAPEQAKGKPVDRRADIWAFGVVLHEMLTGRQLWVGETAPETLAHVISRDPDLSDLPSATPPRLRSLIARCLVKDPRARLRDIGEARVALAEMLAGNTRTGDIQSGAGTRPNRRWWLMAAATAAAAVFLTAVATWQLARPRGAIPPTVIHADLALAGGVLFNPGGSLNVAISPDGSRIVFAGTRGDDLKLFVRELRRPDVKPVAGTDSSIMPFFSPDGEWIGFIAGSKLRRVPVNGGTPTTICDVAGAPHGAVWAPDDTIIFSAGADGGLMRVSASGGTPSSFTSLEPGEVGHRWPSLLPDGRGVLFAAGTGGVWSDARIVLQPLNGGARTIVVHGGTAPHYAATGHIVYGRGPALFALPFDVKRSLVTGAPREVATGILFTDTDGRMQVQLFDDRSARVRGGPGVHTEANARVGRAERQHRTTPGAAAGVRAPAPVTRRPLSRRDCSRGGSRHLGRRHLAHDAFTVHVRERRRRVPGLDARLPAHHIQRDAPGQTAPDAVEAGRRQRSGGGAFHDSAPSAPVVVDTGREDAPDRGSRTHVGNLHGHARERVALALAIDPVS